MQEGKFSKRDMCVGGQAGLGALEVGCTFHPKVTSANGDFSIFMCFFLFTCVACLVFILVSPSCSSSFQIGFSLFVILFLVSSCFSSSCSSS